MKEGEVGTYPIYFTNRLRALYHASGRAFVLGALMRRTFKNLTKEELLLALKDSTFVYQVLQKLGFRKHEGRNNFRLKSRLIELGIPHNHISFGQGQSQRIRKGYTTTNFWDYHLRKYARSGTLKKLGLREGIFENKCRLCGLEGQWLDKALVLQLDHQNGDRSDNRIRNLQILCPNCHSQTLTYAGKYAGKNKAKVGAAIKSLQELDPELLRLIRELQTILPELSKKGLLLLVDICDYECRAQTRLARVKALQDATQALSQVK